MSEGKMQIIKNETMLATTNAWIKRLSAFATSNDLNFSKYQETIVVNTVRKIYESGYDIQKYDPNNVADVLYQTAFLRLNPSATPRHCYCIERQIYKDGQRVGSKLEMNIEGEGNDEILRNFGVGIKKDANGQAVGVHKPWIIREGDLYEEGYYEGIKYVPPKWRQKTATVGHKKGKIIRVVYPIERTDGSVEFWGADREDLQPILLKHIEQNLSTFGKNSFSRSHKEKFNELMTNLKEMTFDEVLEKYGKTEIKYKAYNKEYTTRIIQDSYSGSTGEAMILRKLRNVAIRTFPKNFDQTEVARIYETTFEEKYDKPQIDQVVEDKLENDKQDAGSVKIVSVDDVKTEAETEEVENETVDEPRVLTPDDGLVGLKLESMVEVEVAEEKEEEVESEIDKDLNDLDEFFG